MTQPNLPPTLIGNTLTLRPLLASDFEGLYEAASDPTTWELHPDSTRYQRDNFQRRFFDSAIASGGAFAVVDNASQGIIGSSRFYEWDNERAEISIGYTFLSCDFWGSGANQEMKQLMLNYIFAQVQAVWFHVGEINLRSRRAVEKLGEVLKHKKEREFEGKPFTQLYYRLAKSDFLLRS